jgi:hypothetical protein
VSIILFIARVTKLVILQQEIVLTFVFVIVQERIVEMMGVEEAAEHVQHGKPALI